MPSELFKQNIYAMERQTKAEVSFSLIAPEAKEHATVTLPNNGEFSRPEQVINNITNISAPIATFEPNHWRLDGSFVLPKRPTDSNMEVGFWNDVMSDANGYFATPLQATINFSQIQNIKRFNVVFDRPSNNFCTELEVWAYDSAGYEIYHEYTSENNSPHFMTQDGRERVAKIVWRFYRTNNPFRFLRISEFDFGITLYFNEDDIISLSLTTEANPTGGSFPLSQFNLKIKNKDRFDVVDPDSYANFLYSRQPFEFRQGLVLPNNTIEWQYMGVYYMSDWQINDIDVSFRCGSKSSIVENFTYFGSTLEEMSIGLLIERILKKLNLDFYIAPILYDSPSITGFFENINYRNVLAVLAELSCCLAFENQQNTIEFIDIIPKKPTTDYIDYDNAFSQPTAKLASYYNGIVLSEISVSSESNQQLANIKFTVSGEQDITITFDSAQQGTPTYRITSGFTLTNIEWNTMYMTATLSGYGEAEITITGNRLQFLRTEIFYDAPWRDPLEPDYGYVVNLPMMIQTPNFPRFREWFLERKFELLRKRLSADINWRQNFMQKVSDNVSVQINKNFQFPMRAVRQIMNYNNGAMNGSTLLISHRPEGGWNYVLDGRWSLGELPFFSMQ